MRPLAMQGVLSYTAQFPIPWRVLAVTAMFHGANAGVPVSRWVEFKALDPLQAHTYPPGLLARGDSARRVAHALLPIEPIERNRCPRLQNIPPYPPSWQAEFYRLWEKGLTTRACTEMRAAWSMRQCRVPEGVADMRKIASPPPSLLLEGQRA